MGYDEFHSKLQKIKKEYENYHKKPLESIDQLERFLDSRLAKPKSRGVRSLKGLSF